MNMFLALAWLLLGITVLVWQALTGNAVWYVRVGEYQISYGWLMFLFVLYNLKRWQDLRTLRRHSRQRQLELAEQQQSAHPREKHVDPEPPNPEFNFTDQTPKPGADVTDKPAASG
jgi:hypothetical protein